MIMAVELPVELDRLKQIITESGMRLGYESLKEKQLEAVSVFLQGNDTFVSLPTGYGKSTIYAVLPHAFDSIRGKTGSIVVCISPLTSLMMDQCAKYCPKGLDVEFIGEAQTDKLRKERVLKGKVQLVYATPESIIENRKYREMLLSPPYQENLVALAVDEVHCIKSWGDQFRKSFSRIGDLRSLIPRSVKILALTATATYETVSVVIDKLSMQEVKIVALSTCRDNICYKLKSSPSTKIEDLTDDICKEFSQKRTEFPKTILYVRTYKDCIRIYQLLKTKMAGEFTEPVGYPNLSGYRLIEMYTRILPVEKKDEILSSFSNNTNLRLVIATTAFGMGVDIQDVTRVIHWGSPSTTEEYVQETGRSGRNGSDALAILYIISSKKHVTPSMRQYIENKSQCRRELLFKDFIMYSHSATISDCKCCDVCEKNCVCTECLQCI